MNQQLIKTYKSSRTLLFGKKASAKFAEDAQALAEQGWLVQSQSTKDGRMLDNTTTEITVVYVRQAS